MEAKLAEEELLLPWGKNHSQFKWWMPDKFENLTQEMWRTRVKLKWCDYINVKRIFSAVNWLMVWKTVTKNALDLIHGSNTSDQFSCFSSLDVIFTARQRSCGKVMFSQVFVCPPEGLPYSPRGRPPSPLEGTWDQTGSDIISPGRNMIQDGKWHHNPPGTDI